MKNTIITVTIEGKTYYFCLKHAFQFLDTLENQLRGFLTYRIAKKKLRGKRRCTLSITRSM